MVRKKAQNRVRECTADRIFNVVNVILMCIVLVIMLYPLWFVLIASFSDPVQVSMGKVTLLPQGFSLDAYKYCFQEEQIWTGYRTTIIFTVCGVLYNLALLLPAAYAISRKKMAGNTLVQWYFLFTMFFSGGMIPGYLLIKNLGLLNSLPVLFIGGLSVGDLVVTRTFFSSSIPRDLYESAEIDGATEFQMFIKVALPLSTAIIAVEILYFAVSLWNNFFSAMIYISDADLFPLQLVLRNILIQNQSLLNSVDFASLPPEMKSMMEYRSKLAQVMKYSIIYIASAPLLIAYPFVQKHFVKGVMIGALKG